MPLEQYLHTLGKKTGVALKYIPAFVLHRNLGCDTAALLHTDGTHTPICLQVKLVMILEHILM